MRIANKRWVIMLAAVLLSAGTGWAQTADPQDIEQIKRATFTTLDDEQVSVSDFEGKLLMLDFWETWCAPCLESFPDMQKAVDNYPDHFAVLAITPGFADEEKDTRTFIENNDYTFTFVQDSGKLYKKLGVHSLPYKIFIGPEGEYIKTKIGKLPDDFRHIKEMLGEYTDAGIDT